LFKAYLKASQKFKYCRQECRFLPKKQKKTKTEFFNSMPKHAAFVFVQHNPVGVTFVCINFNFDPLRITPSTLGLPLLSTRANCRLARNINKQQQQQKQKQKYIKENCGHISSQSLPSCATLEAFVMTLYHSPLRLLD